MAATTRDLFPPATLAAEPLGDGDGDLQRAIEAYQADPENASLLNCVAREAMARRHFRRAIYAFRRLLDLDPERLSAFMDLSTCLMELGRRKEAIDVLVIVLTMPGATPKARTWAKTRIKELAGSAPAAAKPSRTAADIPRPAPKPRPAISKDLVEMAGRVGFSVTQYQAGDGAAVAEAEAFLARTPDRADVLDWAAFTFYCNDVLDRSLECYERLDELGKADAFALYYMGAIHFRSGRDAEALALWLRLIAEYPDHGAAEKAAHKLKALLGGD